MFNHGRTMRWDNLSHQSHSLQVLVHNHSCHEKIEQIYAYWSPTIDGPGKVKIGLLIWLGWWWGSNWGATCERSLSWLAGWARNGGTHQRSTCGCSNTACFYIAQMCLLYGVGRWWWSESGLMMMQICWKEQRKRVGRRREQARKLQATLVRNYAHWLTDWLAHGGEV